MSIYAPPDTQAALGKGLMPKCQSRALFKDRFADPEAGEDARKDWFSAMVAKSAERSTVRSWHPKRAVLLYARLMSRLMVDLAGGVMENANVQLDRYGIPVIPGSAVKGCARRMALRALHDWIEAGTDRPAADDACKPCCEGFACPAEMLAAIARVFGWTPEEWMTEKRDGQYKSDFAWAVNGDGAILQAARGINPDHGTFGGSIAFLPSSPDEDPGLDLDVVTPHHCDYYEGKLAVATDTENPIPVYFPAVRPQRDGHFFTFPLILLRNTLEEDVKTAKLWLAQGLAIFGIGAKTNSGYGWFDSSLELNLKVLEKKRVIEDAKKKENEQKEAKRDEDLRRQRQARLEAMTPEEKIAAMDDLQLESKVRAFFKEPKRGGPSEEEKIAMVAALKGPRLSVWIQFKAKASRGGELAKAEQSIREFNKLKTEGGKMP
jgi:CRISPR-associated protein Cmr6